MLIFTKGSLYILCRRNSKSSLNESLTQAVTALKEQVSMKKQPELLGICLCSRHPLPTLAVTLDGFAVVIKTQMELIPSLGV